MAQQDRMWSLWGFRSKVEVHAEGQPRRPRVEGGPCLDGQHAISAASPGTGQQEPGPGQLKQAGERSGSLGYRGQNQAGMHTGEQCQELGNWPATAYQGASQARSRLLDGKVMGKWRLNVCPVCGWDSALGAGGVCGGGWGLALCTGCLLV